MRNQATPLAKINEQAAWEHYRNQNRRMGSQASEIAENCERGATPNPEPKSKSASEPPNRNYRQDQRTDRQTTNIAKE